MFEQVRYGDSVELSLARSARKLSRQVIIYVPDTDGETNIPNRTVTGYVRAVETHYISLANEWDNTTDKPASIETRLYEGTVENCVIKALGKIHKLEEDVKTQEREYRGGRDEDIGIVR